MGGRVGKFVDYVIGKVEDRWEDEWEKFVDYVIEDRWEDVTRQVGGFAQ